MKAFVITMRGSGYSLAKSRRCIESMRNCSPELEPVICDAVVPETLSVAERGSYSYPLQGETVEHESGMILKGYRCNDVLRKVACTLSHATVWQVAADLGESVLVLEHDAVFVRRWNPDGWIVREDAIVSINDPRKATRRGGEYHRKISRHGHGTHPADGVNHPGERCPDGLPGNSAYMITPHAAEHALGLVGSGMMWPNDALLCRQLFKGRLFTLFPYVTRVEQEISTTT